MTTANVNVTKVLLKRGNTVQNNNYTGVSGELTIDTQLKTLRVHDGVTAGGNAITATGAIGSYSNTNTAAYLASQSITSANIGAFQTFANANAAAQATSINTVNANIGAYQTYANSNAATQTTSIDSINANVGAYQTYANSNAATQATSIDSINANVGAFQTLANANAATQTTEINSLRANITAANTAITNLTSNAAIQATLLDTLTGNAATQSQVLDTLTSNAAAQATSLTTLLGNAVAQQTSLIDLVANAATQAQAIASVTGTYSNANVSTYLSAFDGNILPAANVTYSLGSETRQWRDLWVSNNTIYIGNTPIRVDGGTLLVNGAPVGGTYGNTQVAAYLPTYTGNIAGNIVKNGNVWTFGTNGTTTFPTNISVDYSGNNVQFPRIIADTGKAFSVQAQGNIGSAALSWTVDPDAAGQYAAVGVTKGGGDNLAKVVLTAQSDSGDVFTAKTWQFNETGTTRFPGDTILAPAGTSVTVQSDNYSQLMWQNANVTVAPNMAINSNFYVAQNNATLDIGYRDGSSAQIIKSWYWNADGTLTLPTAGRINFDYLSISSDANVSAFYAPGGNVKLDAGTGNAQIVANSLNDSKTWTFGTNGATTLPGDIYSGTGAAIKFSKGLEGDVDGAHLQVSNITFLPNVAFEDIPGLNLGLTMAPAIGWTMQNMINSWTANGAVNVSSSTLAAPYSDSGNIGTIALGGPSGSGSIVWAGETDRYALSGNTLAYEPYGNIKGLTVGSSANVIITSNVGPVESFRWIFGANANLTLPETGYLRVGSGIVAGFASSPAPVISGFSSISAENFRFQGNGVNILSAVGANSYGNTQVASYLLNFDGDINFTSSTAIISNVDVITVGAHIQSPAYQFSNGTSIFDGITGGGGTTYTNANVVAMLAANSSVFVGNTNNVNTYSLQSNITQVFIGGNAAIASGNANVTNSTSFLHNMYFAANGTRLVRNTGAGVGLLSFDPTGFTVSGLVTVQTANSAPALPHWIKANVNGLFAPSGFTTSTMTASGTVAVNATTGIQTSQTTFPLVNQTATTILFGGAATSISMGSATIGGSGSNVFVGNAIGTSSGNLTVRAFGTYNSVNSLNSSGGYGNTTYSNIAVTGGSGTGMIISMSGAASGYLASATVTNPGTGYQNGETITIPAGNPGGSLGGTFTLGNYNAAFSGTGNGLANYTFGIDGNLTLPGNVTIASVGSIRYANGVNYASTVTGTYSNVNVEAYIGGNIGAYYAFANANAATQATSINTVNANIGAYQTYANTTFTYSNTNVAAYLTTANISTTGNITAGNVSATRYNFANGVSILSDVVSKTTGSWTVTTGTNTYSIQLAENGTYQLWVDCNIPNGILAYNATATVTNGNVPVVGVQYAWVYNGGGTPIDFVSIPNQFTGTANTIVRSSVAPSATTNRFDFGINNTSGGNVTVRYGWIAIS